MPTEKEIKCPVCKGKNIVKKGKQKLKRRIKQVYYCKDCKKRFVEAPFKWKSFDGRVILWGISYYNLGNTLEKAAKLVSRRFKENVSKSVLHNWLKEYSSIYTYHKIRDRVLKEYGKNVLVAGKRFKHKDQTFDFKFHKAKLQIYGKDFPALIEYLKFEKGCPEKFFYGTLINILTWASAGISIYFKYDTGKYTFWITNLRQQKRNLRAFNYIFTLWDWHSERNFPSLLSDARGLMRKCTMNLFHLRWILRVGGSMLMSQGVGNRSSIFG